MKWFFSFGRSLSIILSLFLVILPQTVQARSARNSKSSKINTIGCTYLNNSFALYDSLQKQVWRFAETGYNEVKSSQCLIDHLQDNGFTIDKGVAGIPTAFIASFGSGSPVIGILAEYDALPGLSQDTVPYRKPLKEGANGHGCGHNLIGTASVAAAVAISKYLAQGHSGTVKLFGCPAEEGGGGKAYMAREGCFDGVDAVFDWHPAFSNELNTSTGLSNLQVRFEFKGITSHASASPERGRSALDAVEAFDYMINLMREHIPSDTRIHYVITDGGKAPNVVPDRAEVLYFFRHQSRKVVAEVFERAKAAAQGAAMGTGTTFDYEIVSGNFERLPNDVLFGLMQSNLEIVGGIKYDDRERAFALEMMKNSSVKDTSILSAVANVKPYEGGYAFSWTSSDVGNVSWVAPVGSILSASFVPGCGALHAWQQVATGGTTIGTKSVMNVAKVFYLTAFDLLNNPEYIKSARDEFEGRRGPDFKFEALVGDRKPPLDYCASSR